MSDINSISPTKSCFHVLPLCLEWNPPRNGGADGCALLGDAGCDSHGGCCGDARGVKPLQGW